MAFRIKYNKARYSIQQRREDGTNGCRGCGEAIPKGRKSWCSKACYDAFEPARVLHFVRQRDKDVCAFCHRDIKQAKVDWWQARRENYALYGSHSAWYAAMPKVEYDHILPFAEGGLTILENMRTLCAPCHRQRTSQWQKARTVFKSKYSDGLIDYSQPLLSDLT